MASTNVQSFIQPIAQGNTPFLANNGNPGTVYNMPNTGSYKPPQASAQNQWALNPSTSQYANDQFWLTQPASNVGGGSPFFTVPPLSVRPPTVFPPAVVPPPGGGGGVTPPVVTGGGGNVGPGIYDPNKPTGGVFTGPAGSVTGPQLPGTSFNDYTQNANGNSGAGINWSGGIQGILGSVGSALGMNEGGGMDWQQALDLILPGDLYNSQTGRWNTGNALVAGANAINPALGALVQLAVDNGWGPAALRQRIIDDGLAQANEDLRGTVSDLTAQTQAILTNRTNQSLADRAASGNNAFMPGGAGWLGVGGNTGTLGSSPFDNAYSGDILSRMDGWNLGTAPTRDNRSGTSTGSGVVWSAENGGNFDGGNERMWMAELDAMKENAPGPDTRRRQ